MSGAIDGEARKAIDHLQRESEGVIELLKNLDERLAAIEAMAGLRVAPEAPPSEGG